MIPQPILKPLEERSDAIADTMSRMMTLFPFFGSYFYGEMKLVETTDLETAATDGETVWVNPEYFAKLSLDERVFGVCHEILHAIMFHLPRAKYWMDIDSSPTGDPYDHAVGNEAADYIINSILKESHIGSMHSSWLYRRDIDSTWTTGGCL